jgi:hypothetical protein
LGVDCQRLVLPMRDLPPGLAAALPYPEELFAVQAARSNVSVGCRDAQ